MYAERGQCVHAGPREIHAHEAARGYPEGRHYCQVADKGPVHTISPFQGYNPINKDMLSLFPPDRTHCIATTVITVA